jgi:PAS domain S-box-containing protein
LSEEAGPDSHGVAASEADRLGRPAPAAAAASQRLLVEDESDEVATDREQGAGNQPGIGQRADAHGLSITQLGITPLAVATMDVEGRITMLNAAAERLFSTSNQEAVGRPYPEVFGPSLSKRMLALFMLVARSGDPRSAQTFQVALPDGRRARLRASAGPLRETDGELIGVFFVAEDQSAMTVAAGTPEQGSVEGAPSGVLRRSIRDSVAAQIDRPSLLGVGGVRQAMSIVHAKVRGYAALAELLAPDEAAQVLLRYHAAALAALEFEGATIDHFGDAILAFWNAPVPQVGHAGMAIRGALALREKVVAMGRHIEFGIGVHSGEAVVGTLGGEHSMYYTAMGDAVTIAARLQSAAPAGVIICSVTVLNAAGQGIRATPLGALEIDGRKDTVDAYSVEELNP